MKIKKAKRIQELSPYLFAEIDKKKNALKARGVDIISLGIGDPDLPTPPHIVATLRQAAGDPANHRYPDYEGLPAFREAAADWYQARFGVTLDPDQEVVSLIGSKEGIAHMPIAFVDPGDVVLCPTRATRSTQSAPASAAAPSTACRSASENASSPTSKAIPADVARAAKMMWLCYPNNPTSATATRDFFREAIDVRRSANDIILCHDAAYSEIYFDGERPISFLEVDGAREVGIEFHSLSKTYNMTGWRVGFAVGNAELDRAVSARSRPTSTRACSRRCRRRASRRSPATKAAWRRPARSTRARRDLVVTALEPRRLRGDRAASDLLRLGRDSQRVHVGGLRDPGARSRPASSSRRATASGRAAKATSASA